MNDSALKQSMQSKSKLAASRNLEESNAYSENFDEESLAKSNNLAEQLKDKQKMATVKEESIDESILEGSQSLVSSERVHSRNTPKVKSPDEEQSLPTDD